MKQVSSLFFIFLAWSTFSDAAEQIIIPAFSVAHGVVLNGVELPQGGAGEVTILIKEMTLTGSTTKGSNPLNIVNSEISAVYQAQILANLKPTTILQNNQELDVIITERLTIDDKPK